jgi:hypothetical protein
LTARLRRHRLDSRLVIWAVVVLQLHLVLVQDLHRHSVEGASGSASPYAPASLTQALDHRRLEGLAPNSQQASLLTAAAGPHMQAVHSQGSPLCTACQITRHGSVQLESPNLAPFQAVEVGDVAPLPLFTFRPVFRCPLTGRAPPLFS